jgi:nitrate reductase assembly molybdenum cofactor insertion protein NarJ
MTDEKRFLLRLLSRCLAYPDAEALEALPELEAAAANLRESRVRERLADFMALMKDRLLL